MGLGEIVSVTDVHIRAVRPDDDLQAVTELLHRAYKPLADAGMRFTATYQDVAMTLQRFEEGYGFVAVVGDHYVGTITVYSTNPNSDADWYKRNGVWHFGQFAVDPAHQECGIGKLLLDFSEHFARLQGARELALDTAEMAYDLIDYYTAAGYRVVGHVQWDVTNYRSVIMTKELL